MSTIERLLIRGIRSFGIQTDDEQLIKFSSPLTLILGENGCGKTTIIECLKYAITGEMPPGSSKGQSFIHDPKIFDYLECLGQVKLMVKNFKGEKLTVTRSMKMGQKRGKPSFETLDGAIHFESGDGKRDAVSKRCVDINAEMCEFMGVSKAIINNVIFCHQEDSSWPLDEGKKLKEKFDAIFGTTEYNKVIEKIIKLRKGQQEQLKLKDSNLKFLEHLKKETEDKTIDLEKAQNKLSNLQEQRLKFENEMKPIQERLTKICQIEMEIGKLQGQKIKLSSELENCQQQMKNLTIKIKKPFDGNIFILENEIKTFKNKMKDKNLELKSLEENLQSIKLYEKKIQLKLTEFERKRTSLILQRQQEQDYLSERGIILKDLCNYFQIDIDDDLETSTDNIERALISIKTCFKNEEEKIKDITRETENIDLEMQKGIDKLREIKANIEGDITSKASQKSQLEKEYEKNEIKIVEIEKSAQEISEIAKEIDKLNDVYENYSRCVDLDGIKQCIQEKKSIITPIEVDIEKLDDDIKFLNSFTKLSAEITLKQIEYNKREQEMKRVQNKHSENFKKIFQTQQIERNFKRNLQISYEKISKNIQTINKTIQNLKLKENEHQIMRKNKKDELNKLEKNLTEYEEKIFEKCRSISYDDILLKTKENIDKLQMEHGALKSSNSIYKKYIQKIESLPCCPLCHKDMNQNEANDLVIELSDEIHNLPEKIVTIEKELKQEQLKYENLLQLKPIIEKIQQYKNDIPKLKENLKTIEEDLLKIENDLILQQNLITEPNTNIELVNSMFGDMSLLDEAIKDVLRLKQDLDNLKVKLPENTRTTLTLDEAQTEKTKLSEKLKTERNDIDTLQEKYDKENEMLNKLREKRNSCKDTQIKLQEGVQALGQLKSRREEIIESINEINHDAEELLKQLQPIKNDLNKRIHEKQELKDENKIILMDLKQKYDNLIKKDDEIQRFTRELKTLSELNLVVEIENLKQSMQHYLDEQKEKVNENTIITKQIEQIKSDISNQEIIERNLHDNFELKTLQKTEIKLKQEYDTLIGDIGELDYKNIVKEKQDLNKKSDTINIKKSEIFGQMGEINNQINSLQTELKQTKYKDSIKNYRKNFYECEILKKIIADLGQYRIALDWSLMQFHSEKMQKINRLIREYWRQIYRGNDIDYIQIQTDESKNDNVDKKRSYNYRVVQSKNNVELDMRGRCSAGQRVLASLIIRMALAETFSSNCGVLALDEPTTNLDRNNILALCEALNRIVDERQSQSNFMLIIITHDEQFISTLGKIQTYHKVFRNDDGKSVVRRVKIA